MDPALLYDEFGKFKESEMLGMANDLYPFYHQSFSRYEEPKSLNDHFLGCGILGRAATRVGGMVGLLPTEIGLPFHWVSFV